MATFQNNKKNYWFSHKTRLVFVHDNTFKDGSRNSAPFKIELFETIGNGRVYIQWTVVFAYYCNNLIIFTAKIKTGWKWPCLEGSIRYDFLFCRHVFTFFWKCQLLSVSLTFCFISKITKKKTGIIVDFIFRGFINRSKHQHMFWKKLLIKCKKNSCERVLKSLKSIYFNTT